VYIVGRYPAQLVDSEKDAAMKPPNFDAIIKHELRFFPSDEMREAFLAVRIPPRETVQRWIYGEESHCCWIIASDDEEQIVYCVTGFGPAFPWSTQRVGEVKLSTSQFDIHASSASTNNT
jgi:hypothetical protein